jgi:spoIIIJ-associated protein
MSKYIEFEGKNIDQAIEIACKKLSLPIDKIKYDIVSHGSSGIFGLVGVKKAKIRVFSNKRPADHDVQKEARDLVKDAFNITDDEPVREKSKRAQDNDHQPDGIHEHLQMAADSGEKALRVILDFITEDTSIDIDIRKEKILFKVEGGNSGLVIGKRGQTLEAIQYLIEKMVNKQNGQRVRVQVDVEGYLENRKDNLKKMASRMAEKVKKINKPVTIGQMNAYDRRIVHLHLKDTQGVRTQSMGEGYYRKLVIFPKKRKRNNRSYD